MVGRSNGLRKIRLILLFILLLGIPLSTKGYSHTQKRSFMTKLIVLLLDGCGYDLATRTMGYLEHLVESGLAAKYKILGELPSSSRPMYETILTGLPAHQHGVVNNSVVRKSEKHSVFDLCSENGLVTAASAYYWISELYVNAPFDFNKDRIQLRSTSSIHHGIYYYEDHYPDSHVLSDGEFLRDQYAPDFLFLHTMNIDDAGHKKKKQPANYEKAALRVNELLSDYIPIWLSNKYQILITADHGMGEEGYHGGNSEIQRMVPLYLVTPHAKAGYHTEEPFSQLYIAPLICNLLRIKKTPEMKNIKDIGVDIVEG